MQVLISAHVASRETFSSADTDGLRRLLREVASANQRPASLLELALAATPDQDALASTLAPKTGNELAPQPAKKVVTQQGDVLPVISAGMLRQQFRHLQALQKQHQGARSGSMPVLPPEPAAPAEHAPSQRSAGSVAPGEAGLLAALQPHQSPPEAPSDCLAQAAACLAELHPSGSPSRHASQQARADHLHTPAESGSFPVAWVNAQASAAQAPAASTACTDMGHAQLGIDKITMPRLDEQLHEARPYSVLSGPGPSACKRETAYPSERLPAGICRPATVPEACCDSSAQACSMPGHLQSGWDHGSAPGQASRMVVHQEKPGQMPSHVRAQPSLIGPHSEHGGKTGNLWGSLYGRGSAAAADAAVTIQLLPAGKPATGSVKLTETAQVRSTENTLPIIMDHHN